MASVESSDATVDRWPRILRAVSFKPGTPKRVCCCPVSPPPSNVRPAKCANLRYRLDRRCRLTGRACPSPAQRWIRSVICSILLFTLANNTADQLLPFFPFFPFNLSRASGAPSCFLGALLVFFPDLPLPPEPAALGFFPLPVPFEPLLAVDPLRSFPLPDALEPLPEVDPLRSFPLPDALEPLLEVDPLRSFPLPDALEPLLEVDPFLPFPLSALSGTDVDPCAGVGSFGGGGAEPSKAPVGICCLVRTDDVLLSLSRFGLLPVTPISISSVCFLSCRSFGLAES